MQKLNFQTGTKTQGHLKIQICMQQLLKIGRLLFIITSVYSSFLLLTIESIWSLTIILRLAKINWCSDRSISNFRWYSMAVANEELSILANLESEWDWSTGTVSCISPHTSSLSTHSSATTADPTAQSEASTSRVESDVETRPGAAFPSSAMSRIRREWSIAEGGVRTWAHRT